MSKQEIVDYLMKPLGSFVGCSSYLQYPNLSHLVPESKPEKKGVNFIERLCFAKDVSGLWTNRAGSLQLISAFRAASFSNQDTSEARPRSIGPAGRARTGSGFLRNGDDAFIQDLTTDI
jgi:hypothetical protein